jgi:urease accessory protein UreH
VNRYPPELEAKLDAVAEFIVEEYLRAGRVQRDDEITREHVARLKAKVIEAAARRAAMARERNRAEGVRHER